MAWTLMGTLGQLTSVSFDTTKNRYRINNTTFNAGSFEIRNTGLTVVHSANVVGQSVHNINTSLIGTHQISGFSDLRLEIEPLNTAPTTPGAFTQPTGELEIGDSKVFSVGASSDAESNLSKYIWEASINNGAYLKVGESASPSFTYTIPTGTSLKMRVKAVDTNGLESAYRESNFYTVTKPKYYWSKYNANQTRIYIDNAPWEYLGQGGRQYNQFYKSYLFDQTGNVYYNVVNQWPDNVTVNMGDVAYAWGGNTHVNKYVATHNSGSYGNTQVDIYVKYASKNTSTINYSQGTLIQSGITAEDGTYPTNGHHSDGYWYVRGSRVNQSIAPPGPFISPESGKVFKPGEVATITTTSTSPPNFSLFEFDYRYGEGAWVGLGYYNNVGRTLTITTDKTLTMVQFRVRNKNTSNVYSDYVYSEVYTIEHNQAPTVTLNTSNNATLYENSTLTIDGSAIDTDADQSVTVYYQINDAPRKVLATNLSKVQIPFNKQLVFKGGKLFDGETAISGDLVDGVAHTLKVWAQDSEGAESVVATRSFYVVPNRAPSLIIDTVAPNGNIDNDKFTISGNAGDPDDNANIKVTYRINANNSVEVYSGTGGEFDFEVSLGQLVVGLNTIVVEVIDNYGAKVSKTIKLNKQEVKTPLLKSTARYKIEPPSGSAKGVLLWIQRDENLQIGVKISMTLKGEQESFVAMNLEGTAPVDTGIVEDEFYYETNEAKDNIILQIDLTRSSVDVDDTITLISGVLE